MTMDEIREFAKALGIQSSGKFENKEDLIRTIQLAEGYTDCFRRIHDCTLEKCAWYDDCIRHPESKD
jgi:hypothetical protein